MMDRGWHGYQRNAMDASSVPNPDDQDALFAEKQLRRQRRMGRTGHCGYDLNRHIELAAAVKKAKADLFARHTLHRTFRK